MKVEIWFQLSNQPIKFDNAQATYQKGDLLCVGYKNAEGEAHVSKYPINNLFKVEEYDFVSSQPKVTKREV